MGNCTGGVGLWALGQSMNCRSDVVGCCWSVGVSQSLDGSVDCSLELLVAPDNYLPVAAKLPTDILLDKYLIHFLHETSECAWIIVLSFTRDQFEQGFKNVVDEIPCAFLDENPRLCPHIHSIRRPLSEHITDYVAKLFILDMIAGRHPRYKDSQVDRCVLTYQDTLS